MMRNGGYGEVVASSGASLRTLFSTSLIRICSVLAAIAVIKAVEHLLPAPFPSVLLDVHGTTYPLTVQTVQWIVFALGLGELVERARSAKEERAQLRMQYLPEDETTVLQTFDLRDIYTRVRHARVSDNQPGYYVPKLIYRIISQFQTTQAIDQCNGVLNSSLELYLHEIDLRYTMIRYVIWAIPTLGFLGTVLGIALALNYAGNSDMTDPSFLKSLTEKLAVAFNTTLLALCLSAILVLVQHLVQAYEERALNMAGQYCLDNLINRLYTE
jgi:biopolymer transport protein ExbB/TolQ